MASDKARYKKWRNRAWAGAILCLGASLAPLIYCLGWWPVPEGMDGLTMSYCIDTHLFRYPRSLLMASVGFVFAGMVLLNRQRTAEGEEEALQRRIERASGRDSRRTPMLDRAAMRGRMTGVLEEIELDEELDLGLGEESERKVDYPQEEEDSESLMAFLQETQEDQKEEKAAGPKIAEKRPGMEGFYTPQGMEDAPVLYLDSGVEDVPVLDRLRRVNNPDLPYQDIDNALHDAFALVMEGQQAVIVRVMPGVYQAAIEIPDRVTVLNHRLPAGMTVDQRLSWLREQQEVDHPDRVTILAPSDAECAVRVMPGQKQGLIGCYVVGRKGVVQTGLRARNCRALAVVHCVFESFSRGGTVLEECGEDLPGRQVLMVGCVWRGNVAIDQGGALSISASVVKVEASIFDSNRAPMGGAIAVMDGEKSVTLERSLLQRNRALTDKVPTCVEELDLMEWRGVTGLGGGLMVRGALVRVVDTIFDGNDAAVGGGAVAALGARVVLKSTGEGRGVCSENRADIGGGILAVGWPEQAAMVRGTGVEVMQNLAKSTGGGVAGVGRAILQFQEAEIRENRATGKANGDGGGVAIYKGAILQGRGLLVVANLSTVRGGGIAVINGNMKLEEGCSINRNRAGAGGGGVSVRTRTDRKLERIVGQPGFSLPFKCKVDGVRISHNQAGGAGGGFEGGNRGDSANFPLSIVVRRPDWIIDNESGTDILEGQNIWVKWAGEIQVKDGVVGRVRLALQ